MMNISVCLCRNRENVERTWSIKYVFFKSIFSILCVILQQSNADYDSYFLIFLYTLLQKKALSTEADSSLRAATSDTTFMWCCRGSPPFQTVSVCWNSPYQQAMNGEKSTTFPCWEYFPAFYFSFRPSIKHFANLDLPSTTSPKQLSKV